MGERRQGTGILELGENLACPDMTDATRATRALAPKPKRACAGGGVARCEYGRSAINGGASRMATGKERQPHMRNATGGGHNSIAVRDRDSAAAVAQS